MHSNREVDSAIYVSRGDRVATGLLAAVFLAVAIGATAYGLLVLAAAAKEIIVAVLAAATSLLSAVFGYAFQRAKDREMATMQRHREIELATRKAKQENYSRILERLAPYIRDPDRSGDEFSTAYLQAWIAGSVAVLQGTQQFLDQRDYRSLDALLRAMRDDLTDEEWGSSRALQDLTSETLFPAPAPTPSPQGLRK